MRVYSYILSLCLSFLVVEKTYSSSVNPEITNEKLTIKSLGITGYVKLAGTRFITDVDSLNFLGIKEIGCPKGKKSDGKGGCEEECSSTDFSLTDNTAAGCLFRSCADGATTRYVCEACKSGYEKNYLTGLCDVVDGSDYPLYRNEVNPDAGEFECIFVGEEEKCRYIRCFVVKGWIFETDRCVSNKCDGFFEGQVQDIKCIEPSICLSGGKIYSRCEACEEGYKPIELMCVSMSDSLLDGVDDKLSCPQSFLPPPAPGCSAANAGKYAACAKSYLFDYGYIAEDHITAPSGLYCLKCAPGYCVGASGYCEPQIMQEERE